MRTIGTLIVILATAACNGADQPAVGESDPGPAARAESGQPEAALQPTAVVTEHDRVVRALSVRDPVPSCAEVEALAEDGRAALLKVVDEVQMPPWAAMRAANCLLSDHGADLEPIAVTWVTDPEFRGLGLLTLNHLDDLGEPAALRVSEAALAGHLAEDARPRVQRSSFEAVRALSPRD